MRLGDSDLWTLTTRMPADSRFDYAFVVADGPPAAPAVPKGFARPIRGSPGNSSIRTTRRAVRQSRASLPGAAPQPWVEAKAGVRRARSSPLKLASKPLKEDRTSACTHRRATTRSRSYPLLIVFDGESYGLDPNALIPVPTIVDNLIAAKKIPPIVVALVANQGTREQRSARIGAVLGVRRDGAGAEAARGAIAPG